MVAAGPEKFRFLQQDDTAYINHSPEEGKYLAKKKEKKESTVSSSSPLPSPSLSSSSKKQCELGFVGGNLRGVC